MQALAYSGYWLATGTLFEDEMTSAYAIEDFPRQSDMVPGIDWLRPNSESDVIERGVELVESISSRVVAYGGPALTWHWQGLTAGMMAYLVNTVMGGNPSARVTIRTFDRARNEWRLLNAVAQIKAYREAGEMDMGGFKRLEMDFAGAKPIVKRVLPVGFAESAFGVPVLTAGVSPAVTASREAFGTATVT